VAREGLDRRERVAIGRAGPARDQRRGRWIELGELGERPLAPRLEPARGAYSARTWATSSVSA
jgi:hypothetical protein